MADPAAVARAAAADAPVAEVDPCLPVVELELGPSGRLLFLSDVHLTGGGPVADFRAPDELVELLDELGRHDGEVLLVLGGDVLDLLQAGGPPPEAVRRVLAADDATRVAAAATRLGSRPGAMVVYLVGNHDAALAWDAEARRAVGAAFGVHVFAQRATIAVTGPDGRTTTVLGEHGHALDAYNRHTDPYDPLDSPAGDHVVEEVVNRFDLLALERPDLQLDQIDNVRPSAAVPVWLVSNFFYRFLRRVLRRFAVPLTLLVLLLHLPVIALLVREVGLGDRTLAAERIGQRAVGWVFVIVLVDVVLVLALAAFLGRSLRDAAAVYGGTPDDDATDRAARAAAMGELLTVRDPAASVLLAGHTHRCLLVPGGRGRVVADSGAWISALVPVRAWLSLPPVFVPAYPCTWVEVHPAVGGALVSLWERRLRVSVRLSWSERLAMRGRPPAAQSAPPRRLLEELALPRPGPLRPDWTPGAAAATASGDPLGSRRWAGLPSAGATPREEPDR